MNKVIGVVIGLMLGGVIAAVIGLQYGATLLLRLGWDLQTIEEPALNLAVAISAVGALAGAYVGAVIASRRRLSSQHTS